MRFEMGLEEWVKIVILKSRLRCRFSPATSSLEKVDATDVRSGVLGDPGQGVSLNAKAR